MDRIGNSWSISDNGLLRATDVYMRTPDDGIKIAVTHLSQIKSSLRKHITTTHTLKSFVLIASNTTDGGKENVC